MKKEQFRTMLKEIIKEVIAETDISLPDDPENDKPVDRTGGKAPTGATDKRWRGKMRMADKLKGDLPDDKKTPFFKGPVGSKKYDDLDESDAPSPEDIENDAPVDRTGAKTTAATDKKWRGGMRTADKLRAGAQSLPPEKRTPFFRGPTGSTKYGDNA